MLPEPGAGEDDGRVSAPRPPPALPRPSNGFIRAVSHNRKRVHEASARLFRSQEFPLSGNSGERLEPGSGARGAGGASAAPRARRGPGGGASPAALRFPPPAPPWHSPPFPVGCSGNPAAEVPGPAGRASFRGRRRVPSASPPRQLIALRPTGLRVCASTARGSPRLCAGRSRVYLVLGGVCGSPRGHAPLVEGEGWRRAGGGGGCLCWGRGASGVLRSSCAPCVLPFVLRRRPRWMRCDRGVQAWAVQIKSS